MTEGSGLKEILKNLVLDIMFRMFIGHLNENKEENMHMTIEFTAEVQINNITFAIFRL